MDPAEVELPEVIPLEGAEVPDAVDHELIRLVDQITTEEDGEEGNTDPPVGQQGDPSGQQQLRGSGPTLPPKQHLPPPPARPEAVHPNQPPLRLSWCWLTR